jgi:hypothetical protein
LRARPNTVRCFDALIFPYDPVISTIENGKMKNSVAIIAAALLTTQNPGSKFETPSKTGSHAIIVALI